ncbi:hypothetical protein [Nostoc sp. PA-18-2419]|uniref:hypothetical protein n=1 Tax=Nostoc sp. PA-18-2419 TaxID=2575443 RepID=UPI00167AD478|nr:hypothetical protein [Nostoc sp. PA-18-2419]
MALFWAICLTHAEYDKDKCKNDPRDTTSEAFAEVIGLLEITLQIVNGNSFWKTLRESHY